MEPWLTALIVGVGIIYGLFQCRCVPAPIARILARIFFYPTLPLTYLQRHRNYWTLIDAHVFLGAAPLVWLGHVDALYARGVRAVINMCDEYPGPIQAYRRVGIEQLHLPTLDHTEPTPEMIHQALAFIDLHKAQKSRVYIHCKAGKGRSAAVALCWLVKERQWTKELAQQYLSSKRAVRHHLDQQPAVQTVCASFQ